MEDSIKKTSQTNYRKRYYNAHPELKDKARDRERRKRAELKAYKAPAQSGEVGKAILFLSVAALVTAILLHEMAQFYAETFGPFLGWATAIALEALVLCFSAISLPSIPQKILSQILVISICVFTIAAMSSKQFGIGQSTQRTNKTILGAIADVTEGISAKSAQRDLMLSKSWISAARKTEVEINVMRQELKQLRSTLLETKTDDSTTYSTVVQIFLRIILMFGNVLVAKHLGEIFKTFNNSAKNLTPIVNVSRKKLKFQHRKKSTRGVIPTFQDLILKGFDNGLRSWGRGFETS